MARSRSMTAAAISLDLASGQPCIEPEVSISSTIRRGGGTSSTGRGRLITGSSSSSGVPS